MGVKAKDIFLALKKKQMLVLLLIGFASGTPLLLTLRTLQAWMTDAQVSLATIGFFIFAGMPYSFKFLWAPAFDRFTPPLGRRRGWLVITQLALTASIAVMAFTDPKTQTAFMALMVLVVSFFGASQDIVADAYRREILSDEELGLGAAVFLAGYRIALWVTGGFALGLADYVSWPYVYLIMAGVMGTGILFTLWADEPENKIAPPRSVREAMIEPLKEFFLRKGALWVLLFILCFKMGDAIAGSMLTPFYKIMGYTNLEIAAIAKTASVPFIIFGGFLGGSLILRWGFIPCLWIFGILQSLSTFSFVLLTMVEHNLYALGFVIIFEDLSAAMGSAAFVGFIGSMTNRRFTATQYALLSSLSVVPMRVFSGMSGVMAETVGWSAFFTICALLAIPGLLLIRVLSTAQSAPTE